MPVAAVDLSEYEDAAKKIDYTLLMGERLSFFDRRRFEILADKQRSSDTGLQLRAMLCLEAGDEDGFHRFFTKALHASSYPSVVHLNYAIALVYWGDQEEAARQLSTALKNPDELIRTGCFSRCIAVSDMLQDDDLTVRLIDIAEQYGISCGDVWPHVAGQVLGGLSDDDPLLCACLDSMATGIVPGDRILSRMKTLVEEIEADHD